MPSSMADIYQVRVECRAKSNTDCPLNTPLLTGDKQTEENPKVTVKQLKSSNHLASLHSALGTTTFSMDL